MTIADHPQTCKRHPRVSIIVPNYNHAAFLEERLLSILAQSYTDYELIVLDDGSTDHSLNVLDRVLAGVPHQLVVSRTNSGRPVLQWSKGLALAKGTYVWIAESDDSADPCFLARLMDCMTESTLLVYCRSSSIDSFGRNIDYSFWADGLDSGQWSSDFCMDSITFVREFMCRRNVIPNASAVVFRRDMVSLESGINFRFVGDWVVWSLSLIGIKGRVHYLHQPLSMFRFHPGSTREVQVGSHESARFIEYSQAVGLMARHRHLGRWHMFLTGLSGGWDWIYDELLRRFPRGDVLNPTRLPLRGMLQLLFYYRILKSPKLRLWLKIVLKYGSCPL